MPKQRQLKVNGSTKETGLPFTRASDYRSLYVNFARVSFNPFELSVLFGEAGILPEEHDKVGVEMKAKVVMSTVEAKLLQQMLTTTINAYEEKYGTIQIPDDAKVGP